MENYAKQITTVIYQEPENKIIEARALCQKTFGTIPEATYYKTLERMSKRGELVHLTKGLYYRPRKSRFGIVPISENNIIKHYIEEGKGLVVGYRLFSQKGLTTQIGKRIEIVSTVITEKKKSIGNIHVSKCEIELNEETASVVEMMEILQNYSSIEDLNRDAFFTYFRNFAMQYSDETVVYVLKNRKYKKSSIAFLKELLDCFEIENTLNQFLSSLSSYKIPQVEDFNEFTRTRRRI